MEIISGKQFMQNKARYLSKILEGAVFIYPTDTIYGIGCDATNSNAVERIRKIKKRDQRPFSVAVPSKSWIHCSCVLNDAARKWLRKLPGPYTLLLKLKSRKAVAKEVNPGTDILGVRIPKNWFAGVVAELGIPIVSTSANITSQHHMTSMGDLDKEVAGKVDFIVYEGRKTGRPSILVKVNEKGAEVVKR